MGRKSVSLITRFLLRLRNRHFFLVDVAALLIAPSIALSLRIGSTGGLAELANSLALLTLLFLGVKLILFHALDLYKRYWRYASVDEFARIALAVGAAFIIESGVFFVLQRGGLVSTGIPASILVTGNIFAFLLVGGPRFLARLANGLHFRSRTVANREPVLIAGAGEAGAMIATELRSNSRLKMWPEIFVDDDPEKLGLQIRGVPVVGDTTSIAEQARSRDIKTAIIALPSATGQSIRRVLEQCVLANLETRTIPGISELLDGTVHVSQLRPVKIEDLLRRDPVRVNETLISQTLKGRRILVTGGGGSIGSELCRQILKYKPASLVVLDHSENAIFEITSELNALKVLNAGTCDVVGFLCDIRDSVRLKRAFEECLPELVFHAAAHKHVSLLEENPGEAVLNNVGGTEIVLDLCTRFDVDRFVMLSSDKAVNPTSIMGATKRIAELLVQHTAHSKNRPYVTVRFGNVLGSRGSVVPIFQKQIKDGGPLTITDPDVERFFMSIPEAAQLVLQAGALAKGGEVYVLDMGEPIKIMDLAKDLIRLSGLDPELDIELEITGLRPGEKLSEELFLQNEKPVATPHEKVLSTTGAVPSTRAIRVSDLFDAASGGTSESILNEIRRLVPEFTHEKNLVPPLQVEGDIPTDPGKAEPVVTGTANQMQG